MEWTKTVEDLLTENKPEEAISFLKEKMTGEHAMERRLLFQYELRLTKSSQDLEKGSKLMLQAVKEKNEIRFELERLLFTLLDVNASLNKSVILFCAAKPHGLESLKIDTEYRTINEALQAAQFDFIMPINSEITPNKFSSSLLSFCPNHLHFSGHGVKEVPGFNSQGVVFEAPNKDPIVPSNAAVVSALKMIIPNIELKGVILNACHSHSLAKEISTLGLYAIGMKDEIADDSAIAFSEGFYSNFGILKQDYKQAFQFGVNNIEMQGLAHANIPVLYHEGSHIAN